MPVWTACFPTEPLQVWLRLHMEHAPPPVELTLWSWIYTALNTFTSNQICTPSECYCHSNGIAFSQGGSTLDITTCCIGVGGWHLHHNHPLLAPHQHHRHTHHTLTLHNCVARLAELHSYLWVKEKQKWHPGYHSSPTHISMLRENELARLVCITLANPRDPGINPKLVPFVMWHFVWQN